MNMTARIVNKSYLIRIAKFLSLTMAEGMAKDKVLAYHILNTQNCNKENETDLAPKYTIKDFQFDDIPLISSVQAVNDLEVVYKNCIHHGLEIDDEVLADIFYTLEDFRNNYDYETMMIYKRHVLL